MKIVSALLLGGTSIPAIITNGIEHIIVIIDICQMHICIDGCLSCPIIFTMLSLSRSNLSLVLVSYYIYYAIAF